MSSSKRYSEVRGASGTLPLVKPKKRVIAPQNARKDLRTAPTTRKIVVPKPKRVITPDRRVIVPRRAIAVPDELLDLIVFLSLDGSQIEVRMLAEVSGDKLLIEQFRTGRDIHCLVGHMLTGWPEERIKQEKNLRKMVKNMHFGIIFGLGRDALYPYVVAKIRSIDGENADLTGITAKRLGKLYDRYFEVYKGVAAFVRRMRKQVETKGYVSTLLGFNREIRKDDDTRTTYWGNQAINTPIQGTAHQFLLIAMALLHLKPKTYNLLQVPLMEVHDALYFYVKLRDLPVAYRQAMQLFQEGTVAYAKKHFKYTLRVPLLAEGSAGFCMGSTVDYAGEPVEEFLSAWRKKHNEISKRSWKDLLPSSLL